MTIMTIIINTDRFCLLCERISKALVAHSYWRREACHLCCRWGATRKEEEEEEEKEKEKEGEEGSKVNTNILVWFFFEDNTFFFTLRICSSSTFGSGAVS